MSNRFSLLLEVLPVADGTAKLVELLMSIVAALLIMLLSVVLWLFKLTVKATDVSLVLLSGAIDTVTIATELCCDADAASCMSESTFALMLAAALIIGSGSISQG